MDIERKAGHLAQGFDDGRANREIGHEVSVHDIDVEKVGPGRLHAGDLFGQPGKIRRQDRRRYANVRAPSFTPSKPSRKKSIHGVWRKHGRKISIGIHETVTGSGQPAHDGFA